MQFQEFFVTHAGQVGISSVLPEFVLVVTVLTPAKVEIGFEDGTWMEVQTVAGGAPVPLPMTGAIVEAVHHGEGEVKLNLRGEEPLRIQTPPGTTRPALVVLPAGANGAASGRETP